MVSILKREIVRDVRDKKRKKILAQAECAPCHKPENPSSSLKLKPHTPYKQPLVTRKPPLNPNHRKNRLQHIEKIAKFAGKY